MSMRPPTTIMATKRTYILAPNFQYRVDGPIQIGNIIADPFRPTKVLSKLTPSPSSNPLGPEEIATVTEREHTLSRTQGRSLNASVFAQFLSTVGAGVDVSTDSDVTRTFTIEELETRYLKAEPRDDDPALRTRLREPRVRTAIESGIFGKQPVYMITGVKLARGLTARQEQRRTRGGGVGAEVPVLDLSVTAGASVSGEKRDEWTSAFRSDSEVLFAYQVHKIKIKGRGGNERVGVDLLETEAAFLHHEKGLEEEDNAEVEDVEVVDAGNLAAEFDVPVETLEVKSDDGGVFVCVVARP